jgi:cysteine desulfurase
LSLSSSKVYAPKGVGCLYVNKKCLLEPIIVGGDQEFGKRSGTENLHAIVVFAHALELAQNLKVKESKRLTPLRDYFIKQAEKNIDKIRINGSKSKRLPNNVNISFAGAEGESLLLLLDEKGICCSTGSACSAQDLNPSHVLMALNIPIELVHCSLRFSLGRFTTKKEIDYCLQNLYLAVKKIRQISSLT